MKQNNPVGRPKRCRRINHDPAVTHFKPAGIPLFILEEVHLTVDELEAIRLADLEGLYQDAAAKEMNVSRQTFGRILVSAHKKVADTLVHGKSLKIEGGEIIMPSKRKFQCFDCNHIWKEPFGTGRPEECPSCKSNNFHRSDDQRGFGPGQRGNGNRHRRRATHAGDSS